MAERFFIIDGLSQIFRCYYAPFQSLSAPNGEPTRATYVFTNMLLQLVREQKPDYLAMRQAPPEDLGIQIERILEIIASQDIPIIMVNGFEADDVLATMAHQLCDRKDLEVFLVSKDKDLDQILTDCVKLFDPGKG